MDSLQERISKLGVFFLIYSIVFILFFKTLQYTIPFVLAIISAYILRTPTKWIMKKLKLSASISSLITSLIYSSAVIALFFIIIYSLISEIIKFSKFIPNIISNNYSYFNNLISYISSEFRNIDPTIVDGIQKFLNTSASSFLNKSMGLGSQILSSLYAILSSIPYIVMVILFSILATYFFTKGLVNPTAKLKSFKNERTARLFEIFSHSKKMIINYILSYALIIFITFSITLIGFLILDINYAFILSLLCALFDLLPVLGMPLIYIPLILMNMISKNYSVAIALGILYAVIFVTRQIIEPKIMSSSLGLNPVAVLAAIFIGLKADGVTGMLFCMFLVVAYNILKKVDVL